MKLNILLIVTDQEYAHPTLPDGYTLPAHERLKARGVTFDNFQATTTLCTPSRGCLYTGQHTPNNGMFDNGNLCYVGAMSTDLLTMGTMLREMGYETGYKGKWHLGQLSYEETSADALEPYGFSDFQENGDTHGLVEEGAWRDAQIGADAAEWLHNRQSSDKPFMLAVNFINPHDIMFYNTGDGHLPGRMSVGGEPDKELYRQRWDVDLPKSFADDYSQQPPFVEAYAAIAQPIYGRIPSDRSDLWQEHINYYLNCLKDVDHEVGKLLDALEASGEAENTIIVYTSDHGELAGAHRLTQKGGVLFRELVNVPLIISHPAGAKGATTQAVASMVDLIPTMLGWAGCKDASTLYPDLVGFDLTPTIVAPESGGPRGAPNKPGLGALYTYDNLISYDRPWFIANIPNLLEIDGNGDRLKSADKFLRKFEDIFATYGKPNSSNKHMIRGVFDGRYKLIRYFAIDNYHMPESVEALLMNNDVALYDLVNDPHEMVNLARAEHPDFDDGVLALMNENLNQLIRDEIGADKSPYGL